MFNNGNLLKGMTNFLRNRRPRHRLCINIRRFVDTMQRTSQRPTNRRLRFLSSRKWERTSFWGTLRTSVRTRGSMKPKWFLFPGVQEERGRDYLGEGHWRMLYGKFPSSHAFSWSRKQCLPELRFQVSLLEDELGFITELHVNRDHQNTNRPSILSPGGFYKVVFKCLVISLEESCYMPYISQPLVPASCLLLHHRGCIGEWWAHTGDPS